MNQEIIYPAIYKHFKGKHYATMGISKPLEAKKFPKDIYNFKKYTPLEIEHTETGKKQIIYCINNQWYHPLEWEKEEIVIYKTLYNGHMTYGRTLKMFASEVDHKKYADVEQEFRFELVRY